MPPTFDVCQYHSLAVQIQICVNESYRGSFGGPPPRGTAIDMLPSLYQHTLRLSHPSLGDNLQRRNSNKRVWDWLVSGALRYGITAENRPHNRHSPSNPGRCSRYQWVFEPPWNGQFSCFVRTISGVRADRVFFYGTPLLDNQNVQSQAPGGYVNQHPC